jgi:2-dehydro-3-deoxyphosphogluconate aldolase / (4S)-4-hydroxy-2-oxoglutarate aldolase
MTLLDRLAAARILAILRMDDVATAGVEVAMRLHGAGVRAIECTLDRAGALDAITALRNGLGSDTLVGAGTVTETTQLDDLARVGVDFCVTPHLDTDLVRRALDLDLPMIPGVMTASEVAAAFRLGVPAVKLFPAGSLGVAYLRSLQGPFGHFPVIPTGGIDVGDVAGWLEAGALCVGLGSALTGPSDIPLALKDLLAG